MSNYGNINRVNTTGIYGTINVGTTAIEAKVGSSALEGRDTVILQPTENGVYYGFDSSVTTVTGIQLFKNQIIELEFTEDVPIFLVGTTGTVVVKVQEAG